MKTPPTDPRPAHEARRRILLGGGAVLAIAGVATALALGGSSVLARLRKPPESKPVVTLEFAPAEVVKPAWTPLPVAIEFSGPLVAPRTAVVRAKAAGTLLSLQVAEGHRVRAGQALGAIDLSDLETKVSERAAMVESAQATLAEAERTHQANIGLAAQHFISPTALQTSQARLDSARAQLKSAQAQLATSRLGVREAALVAPIAGIVGKRHVVPGEKVSAEQPLITVVDLSVLELAGTVGTHEVTMLRAGQPVRVRVEGEREPVSGRIDRIAPQAEAGTRAIGVVVVLENRDERYRAGQYAQANLTLEDGQPRLTVPSTAVGQTSGQDFVWTVEKDALVRRIVVTGRREPDGRRVEVVRGLAPEATVLAVRFDNLKEGQPARVLPTRTAPTASNPASAAPRS
jgi:RND family efflux transporter MFP subunit